MTPTEAPPQLTWYIRSPMSLSRDPWISRRISANKQLSQLLERHEEFPRLVSAYNVAGMIFPPVHLNFEDPTTWGLPEGSYIDLSGCPGQRALYCMHYKVMLEPRNSKGQVVSIVDQARERPGGVWLIHGELSLLFESSWILLDRCGTLSFSVCLFVWMLGATLQFLLLFIPEAFELQGASFSCIGIKADAKLRAVSEQFSYAEMMSLCGRAFHAPSFGVAVLAGLATVRPSVQ